MRLDHLSYAAGPEGLEATAGRLGEQLGMAFIDGGFHPRFGTRNRILPLTEGHYLEVVGVLDHPAADKVPFGQAVRARSLQGGGWLGWVVATDDLFPIQQRLGRESVEGHRSRPDGVLLEWDQIGVKDLLDDRQLPFFIKWRSDPGVHPSTGGHGVALTRIEIAGDHGRVDDWLGGQTGSVVSEVEVDWTEPDGDPGLVGAVFRTASGPVRI